MVLLIGVSAALGLDSCTYDYFVDETNYKIFVPDSVGNYRILIYDSAGGRTGSIKPYSQNPPAKDGLLRFRLPPGKYTVYCYVNTDSLSFTDVDRLDNAAFSLNSIPGMSLDGTPQEDLHVQPSRIRFDKFETEIKHLGNAKTDTVHLSDYTARLTVIFENFPFENYPGIKNVELLAQNAGVKQYLKQYTLTAEPGGYMYDFNNLPPQEEAGILKVEHLFLPSVENSVENEPITLKYTFCGNSPGQPILPIYVTQDTIGNPVRLLSGQQLVIRYKGLNFFSAGYAEWDENIKSTNADFQ